MNDKKNDKNTCYICKGKFYYQIKDESSIAKCNRCGDVLLNGIGLPHKSKYYNLEMATDAVFDTVRKANSAMYATFRSYFSPDEWEKISQEWHQNLHDEVLG